MKINKKIDMNIDVKKRTMNELRQVKEYGYTAPKTKGVGEYCKKDDLAISFIIDLIRHYNNDKELGSEIRSYYLGLNKEI